MKFPRKPLIFALLTAFAGAGYAAEAAPILPPDEIVAQVLRTNPMVQAADGQIRVEEANRDRLQAGSYEWSVRLGGQQRRSKPPAGVDERFNEWNAAIERPIRLPGKASLDGELGAAGIALAETAHGDALHETSRNLLKSWFLWLRESAASNQWQAQVALLEKQTKAVQRRQQLGDAARLEAILSEAALAQAMAQSTQSRVRQQTAAEDLRRRFPGLPVKAPAMLPNPVPVDGSEAEWIAAILADNHELGIARGESRQAQIIAGRSGRDRLPDPTIGIHYSRERAGEDQIVGAYLNIPLPGDGRRAVADAALAQSAVASRREAAAMQKVTAEASLLYQSANAAFSTWQSAHAAAEQLTQVAEMTARAYQLGEGSLNDLLLARRMANEAQLNARLLQLDALELRYRLLLDSHRLWDLD